MTDRELMQQALHTLEGWANHGKWVWPESALEQAKRNTTESIAALRERLAQPEQEPVAWMTFDAAGEEDDIWYDNPDGKLLEGWTYKPLYTALPRQWQGLTEEETDELVRRFARYELLRAIEAKLKEKNHAG